jgi:nucleoside-diphosphate-sugar epimerase
LAPIALHGNARVLVTGASGFVGRALCTRLAELGYSVRRAGRYPPSVQTPADTIPIGEFGPATDWSQAVEQVSVVFHLAARTHVMKETAQDALAEYRRVNVNGTRTLARAAVGAGVRRLVFLSSIKTNGESTGEHPFTEESAPQPEDAYGISKWEAEQALLEVTRGTPLETVILRPPLVYGPGVKGNFLRLMHAIARGLPLPVASVANRRSLVFVDNLADALIAAGISPHAANKTYLVADGEDLSTPDLIRSIGAAMQAHRCLFRFPVPLLLAGAALLGKRGEVQRLTGSLQIDSTKIRRELDWHPRFDLTQGLARTSQWYHSQLLAKPTP